MSTKRYTAKLAIIFPLIAAGALFAAPAATAATQTATPALTSALVAGTPTVVTTEDKTVTRHARTSRSYRKNILVKKWASSATAKRITRHESGGNCRAVSPGGTYRGKWQMNPSFWRSYGGKKFAPSPDRASCYEQDIIAHRGWVDRWWQPWSTF
jgi:hypothetical protein